MAVYAGATLLGAFLLFQVQPVVARFILPWFGGSPTVWTTCMLFFQAALLLGYLYAHLLATKVPTRVQPLIHVALLALSAAMLPITLSMEASQAGIENPTLNIIVILVRSIGFPFIVLAATAPLLQRWFAESYPHASPFRLYALSNLGSLLALLSYPFLVEPFLSLSNQTLVWSATYGLLVVILIGCGAQLRRRAGREANPQRGDPDSALTISARDRLLWVVLSGCGSVVLLATTNQMTQDVAVVPFLWIVPLSLYLISFIICFDRDAWYRRELWVPFYIVSVGFVVYLLHADYGVGEVPLILQVVIYSAAMFGCCMVCHGELVRTRPTVTALTSFYIYVALGGVLGGVFVNLLAPLIFDGYWELHGGLLATAALAGYCIWADQQKRISLALASAVGVTVLAIPLAQHALEQREFSIENRRSFYGVVHVYEVNEGEYNHRKRLFHGRIEHGFQYARKSMRDIPTAYYGTESGVGLVLRFHPVVREGRALAVGAIGMGVGTIAAYATPRDSLRFYELNPQVAKIARDHFTYINRDNVDVVIGDGRVSLQRELEEQGPAQFDVLVVDAFSGDAIPVHLLTREAFELYWKHLRPDGILAFHVSNLHVDLSDVLRRLADSTGKESVLIANESEGVDSSSDWILVTSNQDFLGFGQVAVSVADWERESPNDVLWTDDFSNLNAVVRWN